VSSGLRYIEEEHKEVARGQHDVCYCSSSHRLSFRIHDQTCRLKKQDRQCTYNVTHWCVRVMFIPPRLSKEPDNISPKRSALRRRNVADVNKPYLELQVRSPIFLPNFNQIWTFKTGFHEAPQQRGTARTLPKLIVLFCVPFVCKCVLYCCHRGATQLQLTNISISILCIVPYHTSYHISYHIVYHIV